MKKIDSILSKVCLLCTFSIISFLLVEYTSRFFISSRSSLEQKFAVEYMRQPKPYSMFSGKPYARDLNALGYRGQAPIVIKPADEFRIFMLGGSTVFFGAPPIAELLERKFITNGYQNVRVYNYGVGSSTSGMELARLLYEVSEFQPDLVLFYNGANDYFHPFDWDPRPGYPFNFIAYQSNPLLESNIHNYPTFTMLAYGSNIMRFLFPSYFINNFVPLDEMREKVGWMSEEWKENIATIYISNLIKANNLSIAFGAKFIGFFQPVMSFKENLTKEEKVFFKPEEKQYHLEMQKMIVAKIDEVNKDKDIHIYDLSNTYEHSTEWVYADQVHTRQKSKALVTEKIFEKISTLAIHRPNVDLQKPSQEIVSAQDLNKLNREKLSFERHQALLRNITTIAQPGSFNFDSHQFIFRSWSNPEVTHRWSLGKSSDIIFMIEDNDFFAGKIKLTAGTLGEQMIRISLNNKQLINTILNGDNEVIELSFDKTVLKENQANVLHFEFPDAKQPNSPDPRILALALKSILIQ